MECFSVIPAQAGIHLDLRHYSGSQNGLPAMRTRGSRSASRQVGQTERGQPGLARAQQFARAAGCRSLSAISKPSLVRRRVSSRSRAIADSGDWYNNTQLEAALPPPARAAGAAPGQRIRVLDHHQQAFRHVHPDLDHRGRHQQLVLAVERARIVACFSAAFCRPCTSPIRTSGRPASAFAKVGARPARRLPRNRRSACTPIGLPAFGAGGAADALDPVQGGVRRPTRWW